LHLFFGSIGDRNAALTGVTLGKGILPMDINQAKWFLRVFADGKKLNAVTIKELYLSGYIGIELHPRKEPLLTVITKKGKRVLEPKSLGFIYFSNPAIGSSA
jgi:hypothetical protein